MNYRWIVMDTQTSNAGMISGLGFAAMIIIGGIAGDVILYTYLVNLLGTSGILPILGLGIVLVIIAGFMTNKASRASGLLYMFIFLGCMGVPLFGGITLYVIAKGRKLTL